MQEGFDVFLPIGGKTEHDIICYHERFGTLTVQVKSTSRKSAYGSYEVQLKSVRPNRTESTIHNFDTARQDILAVYIVELDAVIFYISKNIIVKTQLSIKQLDAINLSEVSLIELLESNAAGMAGD